MQLSKKIWTIIVLTVSIIVFAIGLLFIPTLKVRALDFDGCPVFVTGSGSLGGGTTGGGTGGGTGATGSAAAQAMIKLGCDYKKSSSLYKSKMLKAFTDCYGFVATVLKYSGVDPKASYSSRAADAISAVYSKYPSKYQIINVSSTKQLLPGDMLFRTSGGSHASLYVGPGYCGCPGGVISASLGSHGPECSSWYSAMSKAVRVK